MKANEAVHGRWLIWVLAAAFLGLCAAPVFDWVSGCQPAAAQQHNEGDGPSPQVSRVDTMAGEIAAQREDSLDALGLWRELQAQLAEDSLVALGQATEPAPQAKEESRQGIPPWKAFGALALGLILAFFIWGAWAGRRRPPTQAAPARAAQNDGREDTHCHDLK